MLAVDERDGGDDNQETGGTLPNLVDSARRMLLADPISLADFNDRLLERGWLDAHAPRYARAVRTLRQEMVFHVRQGFPRICESALPQGVGALSYELNLSACGAFLSTVPSMLSALAVASRSQ